LVSGGTVSGCGAGSAVEEPSTLKRLYRITVLLLVQGSRYVGPDVAMLVVLVGQEVGLVVIAGDIALDLEQD
jgi:hypothetical protein